MRAAEVATGTAHARSEIRGPARLFWFTRLASAGSFTDKAALREGRFCYEYQDGLFGLTIPIITLNPKPYKGPFEGIVR